MKKGLFFLLLVALSDVNYANVEFNKWKAVVFKHECAELSKQSTSFKCVIDKGDVIFVFPAGYEETELDEYYFAKLVLRLIEVGGTSFYRTTEEMRANKQRVLCRFKSVVDNTYRVSRANIFPVCKRGSYTEKDGWTALD